MGRLETPELEVAPPSSGRGGFRRSRSGFSLPWCTASSPPSSIRGFAPAIVAFTASTFGQVAVVVGSVFFVMSPLVLIDSTRVLQVNARGNEALGLRARAKARAVAHPATAAESF